MKTQVAVRLAPIVVLALFAGCARSVVAPPQDTPESLQVGANQPLLLKARANGVQVYTCTAAAGGYSWTPTGPQARLFNASGTQIGRHYLGPTWKSDDDSKVTGQVKARVDSPTGDLPWLLLSAKSTGGDGVLSPVTAIQRLHTQGGTAPAAGCDEAHAGSQVRVPYHADYYFYGGSANG